MSIINKSTSTTITSESSVQHFDDEVDDHYESIIPKIERYQQRQDDLRRTSIGKYRKVVVVHERDVQQQQLPSTTKPPMRFPNVLLTDESLRGDPKSVARKGPQKSTSRRNRNDTQTIRSVGNVTSDDDDDRPPILEQATEQDVGKKTPSMQPLFRLYAESSLKHTPTLTNVEIDDETLSMDDDDDSDMTRTRMPIRRVRFFDRMGLIRY